MSLNELRTQIRDTIDSLDAVETTAATSVLTWIGSGATFHDMRWVDYRRSRRMVDSCYVPAQVRRFLTKLMRTLGPAVALQW